MVTQVILLIVGIVCLVAALALTLLPRWVAAVPAWCGLLLLHLSYFIAVPTTSLIFWGICALIVTGLWYMQPHGEPDGHRESNLYIGFSAMAGGLLGMIVGPRILILGVVLGAFIGQMAYSRTPAGKWLTTDNFLRYFCAKCLPAIVSIAIVCIAIEGLIID